MFVTGTSISKYMHVTYNLKANESKDENRREYHNTNYVFWQHEQDR
jgi:hypothetical protein